MNYKVLEIGTRMAGGLLTCAAVDSGIQAVRSKTYNFARSAVHLTGAAAAIAVDVGILRSFQKELSDIAIINLKTIARFGAAYPMLKEAVTFSTEVMGGKEPTISAARCAQIFIPTIVSNFLYSQADFIGDFMHCLKPAVAGTGIIGGILGAKEIIQGFRNSDSDKDVTINHLKMGILWSVQCVAFLSLAHYAL